MLHFCHLHYFPVQNLNNNVSLLNLNIWTHRLFFPYAVELITVFICLRFINDTSLLMSINRIDLSQMILNEGVPLGDFTVYKIRGNDWREKNFVGGKLHVPTERPYVLLLTEIKILVEEYLSRAYMNQIKLKMICFSEIKKWDTISTLFAFSTVLCCLTRSVFRARRFWQKNA